MHSDVAEEGTRSIDHPSVGSVDREAATRTCPVVKSPIVTNHRPLRPSYSMRGSLKKSDPVANTVERSYVTRGTPSFEYTPRARFTVSTTWAGPTATWTSGGVRPLGWKERASQPVRRTGDRSWTIKPGAFCAPSGTATVLAPDVTEGMCAPRFSTKRFPPEFGGAPAKKPACTRTTAMRHKPTAPPGRIAATTPLPLSRSSYTIRRSSSDGWLPPVD